LINPSQIATALAVCELIFAVIFNDVAHLSGLDACIYKTRAKKFSRCAIQWSSSRSLGRMAQSAMSIATTQNIASNSKQLISSLIRRTLVRRQC
jgi:hypothetical protein